MRMEVTRTNHEIHSQKEKIKENTEKIKVNKTLPYLVSNVIEVSVFPTDYIAYFPLFRFFHVLASREPSLWVGIWLCIWRLQILDVDPTENGEEDGANVDLDSQRKGKCAVIKTSTRQTYFLPVIIIIKWLRAW